MDVDDEGAWTPSLNTLRVGWTASSPGPGAVIDHYEYAIGTSPSTQNVRNWTSTGSERSMADSALTLTEGQAYYVQVRAVDNHGLVGQPAAADGITAAPGVATIGSAWSVADGVGLSIRGKVVTASTTEALWLEEMDRSSAIKVVSSAAPAVGNRVSVAGVLGMSGVQRALVGDVVIDSGEQAQSPEPVGMVGRDVGGKDCNPLTPGVTGCDALYNIGLLARCWGVVTFSDSSDPSNRFFYLDDGSRASDGGPHMGIRVRCGSLAPPTGGFATVTGIVTLEQVGGRTVPVIVIRDAGDLLPPLHRRARACTRLFRDLRSG